MSRPGKPIEVVFDCMVFLQATANRNSPAARALDLLEAGEVRLFVSRQILKEVRNVLNRPEVRSQLPGITDESVAALFARLQKKATLVSAVPTVFTYPRDPKDEPYLNLAIAAGVAYIVSRDTDLLDLMRWDTEEGRDFQRRFRFLKILDPVSFLKEFEPGVE
jgi:putative PIN family toxin of toxin-antitoxin system